MEFFIWEPHLNTGIEVIDEQHQAIATYINDLHMAASSNDKQLVGDTLIKLLDYTRDHLKFEEQLMDAADYSELVSHHLKHRQFERRIDYYFKHHFEGKNVAIPLISELKMWLTTHILHDDMEYVQELSCYLDGKESCETIAAKAHGISR